MWKSCKMFYKYLFVFVFLIKINHGLAYLEGWDYINLHCRDNDYKPVDWWYIYKPPVDVIPFEELGRNFSFITPDSMGRWQTSYHHITANSMLQHTLDPIFRPSYTEYLAVVAYEGIHGDKDGAESSAMGVLMADEKGGFWMGHTVPGLLDFNVDHPTFPESEASNGHLLMCLSLDLVTLNDIVASIREISPRFTRIQFPPRLSSHLPAFNYLNKPSYMKLKGTPPSRVLNLITQNQSLRARMLISSPGDKNCLYNSFAKSNGLVLDVYGHRDHEKPFCQNDYSVRNIDSISIKGPDFVSYVKKGRDRASFAVSTAAHWQRRGAAGLAQHWTCISSGDESARGGLMLCADNYNVWLSFDNFKIKEPEC